MEWLVSQALLEWQVYNMNPNTENYMSEKDMQTSIEYIIKKIMIEMTPDIKERLGIGYPMDTEEHQITSIQNRAKLVVLNYAIKQNTPKNEGESIKNINAFD